MIGLQSTEIRLCIWALCHWWSARYDCKVMLVIFVPPQIHFRGFNRHL